MSTPGLLYVTMQPKPGLLPAQFHEWYNNEHGPLRLRFPHIFPNGLRYQATDGLEPTYLAAYDVKQMSSLETPEYTSLREGRSPREAEVIGQVAVDRRFYDFVSSKESPLFLPIESLTNEEAEGLVTVAVETTLNSADGADAEFNKWYEEEHVPMLSKVPGWLRTRRFKTSVLEKSSTTSYIALHDYAKENGLGGPEHKASMATQWREEVEKYIASKNRRVYSLFYVFGPAPRDLQSLSQLPKNISTFASIPKWQTKTTNDPEPVINSYVPLSDGLDITYQLEGNTDPEAPTVAFINSLLTSYKMWDPLVQILKKQRPDLRILRFDTRGRHSIPQPPKPVTLDTVADDLSAILAALRIPKLHALIGVSMGGASTLKFALKYPDKLGKFIACDFNVASSEANTQAWKDRIQIAESTLEDGSPGIKKLAGVTVERWFHPDSFKNTAVAQPMIDMVAQNDIEGFRYGCQALWDYNMRDELKGSKVPGLLVVGDSDGKGALVKAMEGFKDSLGKDGTKLAIIPQTGHLPMWENASAFWDGISSFL